MPFSYNSNRDLTAIVEISRLLIVLKRLCDSPTWVLSACRGVHCLLSVSKDSRQGTAAAPESESLRVLCRQLIDPNRPHPFTTGGQHRVQRLDLDADIVLVDSPNFTTLFGGTESLRSYWHNLATTK